MDETETVQEQIKISVFTPIIYVGLVLTCFVTFSIIYRRRTLKRLTKVEPIFSHNYAAQLYEFLKESYSDPSIPSDKKPHSRVMKAALLRRGAEAVRRSLKLKENSTYFNKLYQEGLIGDDIFKNFEIQARFQEFELKEIVSECETYKKGWSQTFFNICQEICFNEALRKRIGSFDERNKVLSEIWELSETLKENPDLEKVEQKKATTKKSGNTSSEKSTNSDQPQKGKTNAYDSGTEKSHDKKSKQKSN